MGRFIRLRGEEAERSYDPGGQVYNGPLTGWEIMADAPPPPTKRRSGSRRSPRSRRSKPDEVTGFVDTTDYLSG